MERIRVVGVLYRNYRENVILDMDLCNLLGITKRMRLIVYKSDGGDIFLKTEEVKYSEQDNSYGYAVDIDQIPFVWEKELDLKSLTSYSELLEENRRLKEILASIHKISEIDQSNKI